MRRAGFFPRFSESIPLAIAAVGCIAVSLYLVSPLVGCATSPAIAPLDQALDPSQRTWARQGAIERVPTDQVFDLFVLVTTSRHPIQVRQAAAQRMLTSDPQRFWQQASQRAAQIDDWPMIRLLSAAAQQAEAQNALPWLVRSWSAPSTIVSDENRPERQAIESITEDSAEAFLSLLVFTPRDGQPMALGIAAWTVLARLTEHEALAQLIRQRAKGSDPLLDALMWSVEVVEVLPADREAILRLQTLMARLTPAQWQQCKNWKMSRPPSAAQNLALRHLPALMRTPQAQSNWTRQQWRERTKGRLAGRQHVQRGQEVRDAVVSSGPEAFEASADKLSVEDMLVLNAVLDGLEEPELVAELFAQADADLLDTSSEHGGVLSWDETARLSATAFTPMIRRNDQIYYASDACVRAMHVGLAHYHFHAQRYENARWAGPGKGDLAFADKLHANCVVFTFIDRRTLNADVYLPGGVVIDLGCISR